MPCFKVLKLVLVTARTSSALGDFKMIIFEKFLLLLSVALEGRDPGSISVPSASWLYVLGYLSILKVLFSWN